jgi:hypothetical protein
VPSSIAPAAVGEAFNAVSAQALNLRGYAEAMFRWFGHEPKLRFQPFEEWKADEAEEDAQTTWEHIIRSPCHSVEKARRRLGFEPRYSSLAAVQEAVAALIAAGQVEAPPAPQRIHTEEPDRKSGTSSGLTCLLPGSAGAKSYAVEGSGAEKSE